MRSSIAPHTNSLQRKGRAMTARRSSTRPYYIGLSEEYSITPTDNSMWFWRRVVFASKEDIGAPQGASTQMGTESAVNSAISTRPMRDLSGNNTSINYGQIYTDLVGDLFEGIYTTDWTNPLRAKVDRRLVTVLSDRLRTITSHNDVARPAIIKTYVPIKKTVEYQDEENGLNISSYPISVTSKPGIGNIYVVDFFACPRPAGGDTSTIAISSQSTLYWHEK
uniref:Capsid protein n=1 Tax=Emberiza tristrami Genomoviridae sp. TaxID=2814951 RepID=A0A8E7L4L5_9VIRU|nr:MAG: capsid protein [Emberiza tristrami Genomoviridae sp.]